MSNELKEKITQLKKTIEEWPIEQKASFTDGISDGLLIALLVAKDAGINLAQNPHLNELSTFLCSQDCPPVKKRTKTAKEPKSTWEQLPEDIKTLLKRAIACRLRIQKNEFDTSLDVEELIGKHFFVILAIANRKALDDAIQDICTLRYLNCLTFVDRQSVRSEVEACYETFKNEIACVESYNKMSLRRNSKAKDVWNYIRSNARLDFAYEDDDLREIDAKYMDSN